MPSSAAVQTALAGWASRIPVAPTIVCLGGTSGIGEAIAYKMASLSQQPDLHLIGRNETAAEGIIGRLKQVNASGTYFFHKCDLTLVSEIKKLNAKLSSELKKVDYLFLSPGILTMAGRTETSEGNDRKLMLHYYARMAVLNALESKLSSGARVLSVLDGRGGNPSQLIWDDLDLKRNYSLNNAKNHACTMNDIALQRFGEKRTDVKFFHSFPGLVKTPLFKDLPLYARVGSSLISAVVGITPEESASAMLYPLLCEDAAPYETGGAGFFNSKGDPVGGKVVSTPDQQTQVCEHTMKLLA